MKNNFIYLLICMAALPTLAATKRYDLTIRNEKINLSGKKEVDFALTVNHSIPAPTLTFTEGDDAEILVKNELPNNEEVSIHWHGILLPPEEDGVAYVNTPPIHSGKSHLFKFKIRQSGTYWYHSHTGVQEQKGVYGAFIIHPKKRTINYHKEAVVVLSDWSDENANKIIRNLRKDGDYYQYKKKSMRSYFEAIKSKKLTNYLSNEWSRMGGMDLSDVGYDAFLINGKKSSPLLAAKQGETIRLRIINAAASSYFHLSLAGLPMQVISADGIDIDPIFTKELFMGMAETYDVLFTLPDNKNYELRATAQDVTGHASTWIGINEKVVAPEKEIPDPYALMDHGSGGEHHGHGHHASQAKIVESLTVDDLKSLEPTSFPPNKKIHSLELRLNGDMERYIWHINGKAIYEERLLVINEGEIVRIKFINETMMHHPMHLHGHFFRVINKNGDYSPLKHTVDVPPHQTRTIEFYADEPGQWMLHCHNLYHMKTGMARVIKYRDYKQSPEMEKHDAHDPHRHNHIYTHTQIEAASNHAALAFSLKRTWDELDLEVEAADSVGKNFQIARKWEIDGDLTYRRWSSNFFNYFASGIIYHSHTFASIGIGYTLPFLIESAISINHKGKFQLDLEKRFQWISYLFSDVEFTWRPKWEGDRDSEFELSLMYGPSWTWATGLMLTEKSLALGVQVQF